MSEALVRADKVLLFEATSKKIVSFHAHPLGWHYGYGVPAPPKIVMRALDVLSHYASLGLYETDAFPGADGEIAITAYRGTFYLRVGLEVDNTVTVLLEDQGEGVLDKDRLSLAQAYVLIKNSAEIIEQACPTPGWSTLAHMIQGVENLTTMPLNMTQMTDSYPSLTYNVWPSLQSGSANTFDSTTQEYQENRQYFGNLNGINLNFNQMAGA